MSDTTRRGYLKTVLSAIGGLAAGHSILISSAAAQPVGRTMSIVMPEKLAIASTPKPTQKVLEAASKTQVVEAIAPTLEHMVTAAGFNLNADQLKGLRDAFAARGVVTVRPGGANMEATVSVEVNSLNYTSKTMGRVVRPG